jgi:hypothetical protein
MQPLEHAKTLSESVDDLNSEVGVLHEEIAQHGDDDAVATLNSCAIVLLTRFEKEEKQLSDLGEGIALLTRALRLCPAPHPLRSRSLYNLAKALLTRFNQGGQNNDLDDCISLHREALKLRFAPHPN